MSNNSNLKSSISQKFYEAEETWNLEQLYTDLTIAKQQYRASSRQRLTCTEKAHLRGFLCDYSPSEIAAELHRDCNGLRVDWSRGLYRYIETLTEKSIKNWKDIVILLAEYRLETNLATIPQPTILITPSPTKIDCYEAVDTSVFYGRETELETLKQWVIEDCCRIVTVRGMAGMGKTKLVSKFIQPLQTEFDYIIWRNLSHAPPLIEVLADLIEFLSEKPDKKLENLRLINKLMKSLIPL